MSERDVFSSKLLADIQLPSSYGVFTFGKDLGINIGEGR